MIIAGFGLFEAVLAFIQFPGWGVGFGMAILPIVMLWYLNSADVKVAFNAIPVTIPGSVIGSTTSRLTVCLPKKS